MNGPHQGQPVTRAGAALSEAQAAMVLVHGRGATAESILDLSRAFDRTDLAYLAPQARGRTWYPYSFLAPLAHNEPGLSSGLHALSAVLTALEDAGLPAERVVLLGFSQGACLALEYAARHPRRYGGVVALSGGLLGSGEREGRLPPDDKTFAYDGDLAGTPVFLGCSDVDPHIPVERVRTSAAVLDALGGTVTTRIYEGMGHTINEDELLFTRSLLDALSRTGEAPGPTPHADRS